jgi:hypothetical protein
VFRVKSICLLNEQVVFDDVYDTTHGALVGIVHDQVSVVLLNKLLILLSFRSGQCSGFRTFGSSVSWVRPTKPKPIYSSNLLKWIVAVRGLQRHFFKGPVVRNTWSSPNEV